MATSGTGLRGELREGEPLARHTSWRVGAQVSDKHANFIINSGSASARDIAAQIAQVRDLVEQQTGVRLVPEVRLAGDGGSL